MKIEERANMAAKEMYGYVQNEYSCGYIQGATEQIDKACEWLKMHLAEWSQFDDKDIENFRKAMEG